MRKQSNDIAIRIALFILFWSFYYWVASRFAATSAFRHDSLIFQTDAPEVIKNLTSLTEGHGDSNTHPLFSLFFNPIGLLLTQLTGSPIEASILMTSFFGALTVVLAQIFFYRANLSRSLSILAASILGFSASNVIFSSVPERHIFAASSLVLAYLLAVLPSEGLWKFVPVNIFAFGITSTNFIQSSIIAFFTLFRNRFNKSFAVKFFTLTFASLAIAALLSLLQLWIYPTSRPFFLPGIYREELYYVARPYAIGMGAFLTRILELIAHLLAYSFIAPSLVVTQKKGLNWITFQGGMFGNYDILSAIAILLWIGVLVWSVYQSLRDRVDRLPLYRSIGCCIGFQFLLHSLYGDDFFIYSCNWTFSILALGILSSAHWFKTAKLDVRFLSGFWTFFLFAEAIASLRLIGKILEIYSA